MGDRIDGDPSDGLPPAGSARGDGIDQRIVGDRLMEAGEPELALEAYMRAAADAGDMGQDGLDADLRLGMAAASARLGRLGQAERALRDLAEERPRDPRVLNDLGVVLLQRGRTAEAERVLKTAFALQPSPEIRGNLRAAQAKLAPIRYEDAGEDAFTLTRRADGTYRLVPPGE